MLTEMPEYQELLSPYDYSIKYPEQRKHKTAAGNGIIPGVQLITTYETKEKPLSSETVENVIKEYFCDGEYLLRNS